jgi:hypothetical protein
MTRNIFIIGLSAGAVALALACSDNTDATPASASEGPSSSSGGSSGSSGGSGFKDCGGSSGTPGTETCTEAEMKPYVECVTAQCDPKYKECYGPNYQTGSFSGPCGSYIECTQKCECNDTACIMACKTDAACATCLERASSCSQGCSLPACASGSGKANCETLQACCDAAAADKKDGCLAAKDNAAGDDERCGAYYHGFKGAGLCP